MIQVIKKHKQLNEPRLRLLFLLLEVKTLRKGGQETTKCLLFTRVVINCRTLLMSLPVMGSLLSCPRFRSIHTYSFLYVKRSINPRVHHGV